jgi:chromosome segregation ATPase
LHKMRQYKVRLNTAKDKVREYEEALQSLQEEVDKAVENVAVIDRGIAEVKRIIQAPDQLEHHVDVEDVIDTCSMNSLGDDPDTHNLPSRSAGDI